MSRKMIDTLKKTIHKYYHLNRQCRDWLLDNNVKLRVPNRHSFGFSLDNRNKPPFAFLSGSPPQHIAKVCDAIVALSYQGKLYLFIIEQKTSHSESYKKQLVNGKLFCDWLFSLYRWHGHWGSCKLVSIGLLIWQPRQQPRRGGTAHRSNVASQGHPLFDYFLEKKNEINIHLGQLINSL